MFRAKRTITVLVAVLTAVSIIAGPVGSAPVLADEEQTGTLVIRAEVLLPIPAGDAMRNLWYRVSGAEANARGRFFTDAPHEFAWPAGEYFVSGEAPDGWFVTFGGDCDGNGKVTVTGGERSLCSVVFSDEDPVPGEEFDGGVGGAGPESIIIIEKRVVGEDRADGDVTPYGEFAFTLDGQEHGFWEAGVNTYPVDAGEYTVAEVPVAGYTPSYGGDCDSEGRISVPQSRVVTCTITNTLNEAAKPVPSGYVPVPAAPAPSSAPDTAVVAVPEAPVSSDSMSADEVAAIGPLAGIAPCGPGWAGVVFVNILLAVLIVLLWYRRPRGSHWQAAVLLALLVVLILAWSGACGLDRAWVAVVISVIAWLLLWLLGKR
ncbi:MAG TPA: hypothetical protein VD862_01490 [Candidatus Paceibacterota bacterium]|nr:hypothetical protein [Candidatus Paceibacterota bacterium]